MGVKSNKFEHLINLGANLAGTAAGTAMGFLVAGPPGAVLGGTIGSTCTDVLKAIGEEVIDKRLAMSERQLLRSGAVYSFSIVKFKKNLEEQKPLSESFFKSYEPIERSTAEEMLEHVIIKAKDECEEKKIKFLGNLYGNAAFAIVLSKNTLNQLVNLVSDLSYRQICILAMIKNINDHNLRQEDYRGGGIQFPIESQHVLQEIFALESMNLIKCKQQNSGDSEVFFGITDIALGRLYLQPLGENLYNLLNLNEIVEDDILNLVNSLRAIC